MFGNSLIFPSKGIQNEIMLPLPDKVVSNIEGFSFSKDYATGNGTPLDLTTQNKCFFGNIIYQYYCDADSYGRAYINSAIAGAGGGDNGIYYYPSSIGKIDVTGTFEIHSLILTNKFTNYIGLFPVIVSGLFRHSINIEGYILTLKDK